MKGRPVCFVCAGRKRSAKSGCEELKEELLQLEDEYEALHHKQALTFSRVVIFFGRQSDFLRPHFRAWPWILFWRGWSL